MPSSTVTSTPSPTSSNAGLLSVDHLFKDAFDRCRDPRSAEYKAGVRAALAFRIEGKRIARPYDKASASDDAYGAGMVEGHALWRAAVEKIGGAA